MPNLVGIGLSQVPTNSMLGGLAYQSPDHASIKDLDLKNLSQINSEIADTAVDIFIYDTSKDSDGGAWRKRTTHTSWYNETLNTATRGSRREFPAVAVIVATADDVIIYDGDDPDVPMWMIFESDEGSTAYYTHFLGRSSSHSFSAPITSISMLNGLLSVGKTGSSNFAESFNTIDFVKEDVLHRANASFARHSPSSISKRNNATVLISLSGATGGIVNHAINDVAMTVLPNAPIDSATGLPVPTIAVATDGGVSIIRDDGTVVDITAQSGGSYNIASFIAITENNRLIFEQDSANRAVFCIPIPSADRITATNDGSITDKVVMKYYSAGTHIPYPCYFGAAINNGISLGEGDNQALVGNAGELTILHPNFDDPEQGKVAYITSDYNTGWMHGDIKGAFLSDTDATNVTGSELVTNGDFSSALDTNVWQNYSSGSYLATYSIVSGELQIIENNANNYGIITQLITVEVGKTYVLRGDIRATIGEARLWAGLSGGTSTYGYESTTSSSAQTKSFTFVPTSTNCYVSIAAYGSGATGYFDNVSVRIAEEDRSVNNNGLQVFGTVTKSAVATGAELVSYGFSGSNSNYLLQPYNSDLDFGTGDFSIMYWYYQNTSPTNYQDVVSRTTSPLSDGSWTIQHFPSDAVYMYLRVNGSWGSLGNSGSNITHNGWNFIVVARSGSTSKIYFDGREVSSMTQSATLTNTSAQLKINTRFDNTLYPLENGNGVALVRVSASAPSPEQIKKMYEDEKVLFQENAACTLYGSSDAVTALAYDEITDRLHVGTSSGRSDFQGLRRINNTTTAVTTAISAHDEFIVEQ